MKDCKGRHDCKGRRDCKGKTRPHQDPGGFGKAITTLPKGSEKAILGETDTAKPFTPEGSAGDFDTGYGKGSNVVGPQSKTFV